MSPLSRGLRRLQAGTDGSRLQVDSSSMAYCNPTGNLEGVRSTRGIVLAQGQQR